MKSIIVRLSYLVLIPLSCWTVWVAVDFGAKLAALVFLAFLIVFAINDLTGGRLKFIKLSFLVNRFGKREVSGLVFHSLQCAIGLIMLLLIYLFESKWSYLIILVLIIAGIGITLNSLAIVRILRGCKKH